MKIGSAVTFLIFTLTSCSTSNSGSRPWKEMVFAVNQGVRELQPPLGKHVLYIDYRSGGLLVLTGDVSSTNDSARIEQVASNTEGITEVTNQLRVVLDSQREGIIDNAAQIVSALRQQVSPHGYRMTVTEKGNSIILSGTIDHDELRSQIVGIANTVSTVEIVDHLRLSAPLSDTLIKDEAVKEISENAPELSSRVSVSNVTAGNISVNGDLANHVEVDKILTILVAVPGVVQIRSAITIGGKSYSSGGYISSE